jgi:hypothetical protein
MWISTAFQVLRWGGMYENRILTVWLIVSVLCMGRVLWKYYLLCSEQLLNFIFICILLLSHAFIFFRFYLLSIYI